MAEDFKFDVSGYSGVQTEGEQVSLSPMGDSEKGLVSALKTSTLFGAIGNKSHINDTFDAGLKFDLFDEYATENSGATSAELYEGSEGVTERVPFKEWDLGTPQINPMTGTPYDEDTYEELYFNIQEENAARAKEAPVTQDQWDSLADESLFVKLQLGDDGGVSSAYDFEKRRFYLKTLEWQNTNAIENTTALESTVAFISMFGDLDTVATGGLGVAFKGFKAGKNATKWMEANRVKTGAFVGGAYAGGYTATYNDITGTGTDYDIVKSTAIGVGLGTTLGWVSSRISQSKSSGKVIDPESGEPLTKGEALAKEIAKKEAEIETLNKLEKDSAVSQAEAKITSDDIEKGSARYKDRITKLQDEKATLELQLDPKSKTSVDATIESLKSELKATTGKEVTRLQASITKAKTLGEKLIKTIKAKEVKILAIKTRAKYDKGLIKIKEKVSTATTKLSEVRKTLKSTNSLYKEALKKGTVKQQASALTKLNKATERMEKAKQSLIDAKKVEKDTLATKPPFVKSSKALDNIKEDKANIKKLQKEVIKAEKDIVKANKKFDKDSVDIDDLKFNERQAVKSKLNMLQDKIRTTGLKYQDIVKAKLTAQAELASFKEGKLSPEYKDELVNAKEKLNKELTEYLENPISTERLAELPMFKSVPTFIAKLGISPVAILYKSENPNVRALASLLSPPTIGTDEFVNNLNARTFIRAAKADASKLLIDIEKEFIAYKEKGGKDFNRETWFQEVSKERARLVGEQQRARVAKIPNEDTGGKLFNEIVAEAHKSAKYTFNHENEYLNNSINKMEEFYTGFKAQGNELKVDGIVGANEGGYVHQLYDEGTARALGEKAFVDGLVKAQKRYALDHGIAEDMEKWTGSATKAYTMALSENQRYDKMFNMFQPKHQKTSPLNQKSILMYADDASEFINHNTAVNSVTYARGMGGRYALKKFLGISNKEELAPRLKSIGMNSEKEAKAMNAIVDTIAGYREVARYEKGWEESLHMASSMSSILHSMNFGLSAATELTTTVANTGFKNTVKNLIPSFKKTMEIYKRGAASEEDFIHISSLKDIGQAKFGMQVNRVEVGEDFDRVDSFQDSMAKVVNAESIVSGLQLFTDWFKVNAQMSSSDFILAAAKDITKISKSDRRRLNQIGINNAHLTEIHKSSYKDGKFVGSDRSNWSQDLVEVMERGSITQSYNSILHPDGFTLPMGMTDGGDKMSRTLNNSVLKFMKFPIASYEALLLQGISTFDAKIMVGHALNMAMWSQIALAKDAANNWGENSGKTKYDLDKDEGWEKLMVDTLMVMSVTGSISSIGNLGSTLIRGESIQGYSGNLGGVTISDAQRLYRGDVPGSLYGVQLMKSMENLDLIDATFTPKIDFQKSYW